MPAIGIVLVLGVLFFGLTAFASEPKKGKNNKPKDSGPNNGETNTNQSETKPVNSKEIVGGLVSAIPMAGKIFGLFKGLGSLGGGAASGGGAGGALPILPPGLGPFLAGVAAYILIRELTILGQKSKEFARKVGRAAYPPFGVMHSMEVAMMREIFKGGKNVPQMYVTETVTRDERLDIDFGEIRSVGEFTTFSKPEELTVTQWRLINQFVRHVVLQSLAFQSYVAAAFNTNWKGMSGMGRPTKSINDLGFHGQPVNSWNEVDFSKSIPYDSIPTPGGMYFDLSGGLNSLSLPNDGASIGRASLDGIIAATMLLQNDPTFWLIYEKPVYAKQKFDWGNYARLGATYSEAKAVFPPGTYASETGFAIVLHKEDAGVLYGWNGGATFEDILANVETLDQENERLRNQLEQEGNALRARENEENAKADAQRRADAIASKLEELATTPTDPISRAPASSSGNQWGLIVNENAYPPSDSTTLQSTGQSSVGQNRR